MKPTQPTSINGLEFDALISIDKNLEATVPQYSVEDGFSVSDAIIISPVNISMVLYVTNTPVTWASRHGVDQTRVNTVCKRLEEIFMSHDTVMVVTPDEVFTNMAITSLTLSKNAETGNYASEIPISLVKVYVTKARTTTIPDSYGKTGTQYLIRFTYNDTADYWTFGLYTPLNVPVVIGIKIIPNFPLNLFYGVTSLPFGVFVVMTNLDHIGRDDFRNGKAKFIFAPV